MISNTTLSLISLTGIFLNSAYECVDAFFGKKCDRKADWDVVERLSGNFDLILTLSSASKEYQSILAVGINHDSMKAFAGEAMNEFEARDILGEFANTYCALLSDRQEFYSRFGILLQSIPVLYSKGQQFLPFIAGVQGKVWIGENWLYIGYAIQKNQSTVKVIMK